MCWLWRLIHENHHIGKPTRLGGTRNVNDKIEIYQHTIFIGYNVTLGGQQSL